MDEEFLNNQNGMDGYKRWIPAWSTAVIDNYEIPCWPPPVPPRRCQRQEEHQDKGEEEEPIRLTKFDCKSAISGFRSNIIVVFQDERILLKKERGALAFDQLNPNLVFYQQLKMGLEVANYLEKNGVRDFRLLSNDVIGLRVMENELKKMKIGIPMASSTPFHQVDPLERQVNSTDVTILLLFHSPESSQLKFQEEMGKVLKTAVKASRNGIIVLATVGLLPLDQLEDPTLRQLLTELVNENHAHLESHHSHLIQFYQNIFKRQLITKLQSQSNLTEDSLMESWNIANAEFTSFKETIGNALSILIPTPGPKNNVELYCPHHSFIHPTIFNSLDLHQASPSGGCREFCEKKLKCGRLCPLPCHPLDIHHNSEAFQCEDHWVTKLCSAEGHLTLRKCWDEDERCYEESTPDFPCDHLTSQYQGSLLKCFEKNALQCDLIVPKDLPCGHVEYANCWNKLEDFKCPVVVSKELPICGHSVQVPCSEPVDNLPCMEIVSVLKNCGKHMEETACQNIRIGIEVKCLIKCEKLCARNAHPCGNEHSCSEPCPPCRSDVKWNLLECGHSVLKLCFEELDLNTYQCQEICGKKRATCPQNEDHSCTKFCYEDCGECRRKVIVLPKSCPRNHFIYPMCFEAHVKSLEPCEHLVYPKVYPACGHKVLVPCHTAEKVTKEELQKLCDVQCKHIFTKESECGHVCKGNCYTCYQGRIHQRCVEPCGRILICGHSCVMPCSKVCPPCSRPCYNKCEHFECEFECGVPCTMNCLEPCPYKCGHSSCSKLCSEVCDKPICFEPCKLLLKCGHSCIGFCGEICPPYCHVCSPQMILKDPFFYRDDEENKGEEENIRFLFLPDCAHCLDSYTMDVWMEMEASTEDEIQPKHCPICRTRITSFRRYSKIMNRNRQLIDSIRQRTYGGVKEIKESLDTVGYLLFSYVEKCPTDDHLSGDYLGFLLDSLAGPIFLNKVKFIEWMSKEWIKVSEEMRQVSGRLPQPLLLTSFVDYWMELLGIISGRFWPLHPNEVGDFQRELRRIHDAIALYKRVTNREHRWTLELATSTEGMKRIKAAEEVLFAAKHYGERERGLVKRKVEELNGILRVTVNITEEEKRDVVGAFGERAGRWFKCCNGHVYVITECGGAMETGNCPECGVEIGGDQHLMAERNYLATEMDGAQVAIWPTALERGERGQVVPE